MLHDMRESKVLNRNIANDPALPMNHRTADQEALDTPPELGLERTLRAKVLSRLFWPQLNDDRFNPPAEIRGLQKQFETGFESLKPSRKLAWLNALGYATVELELADRTLVEKVPTWQASVIYAFDDAATDSSQQSAGITRSVAQLTAKLEMDENLVRHALKFWTAKRVLLEVAPDTFGVLETLEQRNADRTAAAGALANHGLGAADASPTKRAPEERAAAADDKMKVYWQFIVGMLTNAGPMEVPRILMMLNLTMPGGFPHPEKELRDFLNRMVQEDRLHLSTGVYSIAR
jgi:anaphase-promoting complex subunit 2